MSKYFLARSGRVRLIIIVLVVTLLLALIFATLFFQDRPTRTEDKAFIGIMAGHPTVDEIIDFVDEVKEYVNLIIVSELSITTNSSALYTVFDYLYSQDLYFIPFMAFEEKIDDPNFFKTAESRWGNHFIGVYTFDEPGGKQLDFEGHRPVSNAISYADAASQYMDVVARRGLLDFANDFNRTEPFTIFTSDYALYWFDYSACYNIVLAQFGWNHSRPINIALCRGASNAFNGDWGAIITWTYQHPPYIGSPEELYDDMTLAYQNGAKYIIVFNYPTNQTQYGLLTQEHLESIQNFWRYTQNTPRPQKTAEIAYVLPQNYGYGFRGPNDRIWGLFGPDELSAKVWNAVNNLLERYGTNLDIIYETMDANTTQKYNKLIYWNGT
jgi:predicted protein tyrosine phosphatase